MLTSEMIKILSDSMSEFGDVPVKLMDSESGDWIDVKDVVKGHPYTGKNGGLNRSEPVNMVAMTSMSMSNDLSLV